MIKKVVIESPYSGDIETNVKYLLECIQHSCFTCKEAPFASHALYTRSPENGEHVVDTPGRRPHGIQCGFEWGNHADLVAIYMDLGLTTGMKHAIEFWLKEGKEIEYRRIRS